MPFCQLSMVPHPLHIVAGRGRLGQLLIFCDALFVHQMIEDLALLREFDESRLSQPLCHFVPDFEWERGV